MKPLRDYRRKRDFRRTPEPSRDSPARRAAGLRFCVQKHRARRLHYDFRLELDGVLKSWAVPKGPSPTPGDKRLAVEVEDHPLAYRTFEGRIPEGQYGAGTVQLWDEGIWTPEGDPHDGLKKGRLRFSLQGRRLDGRWTLVRMQDRDGGKTNWLLMRSSGGRRRPAPRAEGVPAFVEPALATLVDAAPEGDGWIHELKFDGYRLLARLDQKKIVLSTRSGLDWTSRFPATAAALAKLGVSGALLDGEIVALDERGVSSFQALQRALSAGSTKELIYQVFDLLYLGGEDLRERPLLERKKALQAFVPASGPLRYTDHVVGSGEDFRREACRFALEGIISKRADSPYRSGRGTDWLKVKCGREQEFVIGGFTDPEGGRRGLGALLLGYYRRPDELVYAGRVGTGFDDMILAELRDWLGRLERKTEPFVEGPAGPERRGVHWVEPTLVAQVKFAGWTGDRRLRTASFQGLRQDKPAPEVTGEEAVAAPAKVVAAPRVAGVPISSPDRLIYPEQRLTKRDVAAYYESVAPWMLPHVAGRPLSLLRCPRGRGMPCFFQKHWEDELPFVRELRLREKGDRRPYAVVEDVRGLVMLAQRGVIEVHPWGSRADAVEKPDLCVFDLDPGPDVPWPDVADAARRLRGRLRGLGLEAFLKTSGGKGLHLVLPLEPRAGWEALKAWAKGVAAAMAAEDPARYTASVSKAARGGRIFIDYLRNGRGATAVAPYSLRARPNAPVALPLAWEELDRLSRADAETLRSVPARLRGAPDPWASFFQVRQRLPDSK